VVLFYLRKGKQKMGCNKLIIKKFLLKVLWEITFDAPSGANNPAVLLVL
jgi:hypothetical protein